MASDTFDKIDGKPIRWTDKAGLVHACEGAEVHPGIRLIWTLCERDVPANKAWLLDGPSAHEMCVVCMKRLNDRENAAEAAYDRQQQSLMETGGPDDSTYRRDMIAAGRGHLLR